MPADGTRNLTDIRNRTAEKQQNFHRMGGLASGIARKKKKTIISILDEALQRPITNEAIRAKFKEQGWEDEDLITMLMLVTKLIQLALDGDLDAIKYINELTGVSPVIRLKKEEIKIKKEELKLKETIFKQKASVNKNDDNDDVIINLNF